MPFETRKPDPTRAEAAKPRSSAPMRLPYGRNGSAPIREAIESIGKRSRSGLTGDRYATAATTAAARARTHVSEIAERNRTPSFLPDADQARPPADAVATTRCPLCNRVEPVVILRCSLCRTILRRCFDCGSYDSEAQQCRALDGLAIETDDAEEPIEDSPSYLCQKYWPRPKRVGIALAMAGSAIG